MVWVSLLLMKGPSPKTSVVTVPAWSPKSAGDRRTTCSLDWHKGTHARVRRSPTATLCLEMFLPSACDSPQGSIGEYPRAVCRTINLRAMHIGNRSTAIVWLGRQL